MKLIVALIKPYKLEEVRSTLTDLGVEGMTITEVKVVDPGQQPPDALRPGEPRFSLVPKMRLELAVPVSKAAAVIEAIGRAAWTGRRGDGRILAGAVEQAVRVRTAESGDGVLWNGGALGRWPGPDSSRAT
jgi:nitrogen regulatory protein PII